MKKVKKSKKFKTTYRVRNKNKNRKRINIEFILKPKKVEKIEKELTLIEKIKREFKREKNKDQKTLYNIIEKYYKEDKNELINEFNLELSKKDEKKLRKNASVKSCVQSYEKIHS